MKTLLAATAAAALLLTAAAATPVQAHWFWAHGAWHWRPDRVVVMPRHPAHRYWHESRHYYYR